MFRDFEKNFFGVVTATIVAVTIANIITNPTASLGLAKVFFGFPVNLAVALRATGNR